MIDRIRKLLAKGENAAATEAEAESFVRKAFALMEEHMISEQDVRREESEYVKDTREMKYRSGWREGLADSCGRLMGAAFSYHPSTNMCSFTGLPSNTDAAWALYFYLERQCVRITRTVYDNTKQQRKAEKGVAIGLARRMYEMRTTLPEGRQLVPMEHGNAEAAMNTANPRIRVDDKTMKVDSKEVQAGVTLADSIRIRDEI